jgi:hypothetical protein
MINKKYANCISQQRLRGVVLVAQPTTHFFNPRLCDVTSSNLLPESISDSKQVYYYMFISFFDTLISSWNFYNGRLVIRHTLRNKMEWQLQSKNSWLYHVLSCSKFCTTSKTTSIVLIIYFSILLHCVVQLLLQVMFPSVCSFIIFWFSLSFTTCFGLHGHLHVCRILHIFIFICLKDSALLLFFFMWSQSACFPFVFCSCAVLLRYFCCFLANF